MRRYPVRSADWPAATTVDALLAGALALAAGCSTARPLKPLAAGAFALESSIPAVWIGTAVSPIQIGSVVLGARYGVTDTAEARFRLHPVPLFVGIVAIEGGGVWHVQPADGLMPGLHLTADVSLLTAPELWGDGAAASLRGAGDLAVIAHWQPHRSLWPYIVADTAVIFEDGSVVTSFMTGLQIFGGRMFELSLEVGLVGYSSRGEDLTQPFLGAAGRGAFWGGIGLAYRSDG